jgi:hypothetical protein
LREFCALLTFADLFPDSSFSSLPPSNHHYEELGVSVRDTATRVFSNSSVGATWWRCRLLLLVLVVVVPAAGVAALGAGVLGCVHGWVLVHWLCARRCRPSWGVG